MARKVPFFCYLDEEIKAKFAEYVFAKYGSLHGHLGDELAEAIKYYLSNVASQNYEEFDKSISKPNKRHIKLLYWLVEDFPVQVTQIDLENFIVENFGTDKRTRKKYINDFLVRMRFIEVQKAIYGKNVIYKVNLERIVDYLKKFAPKEKIEQLELILKQVKGKRERTTSKRGVPIESDNGIGREPTDEVKKYAAERYEAGDTLDEILNKIEEFGVSTSKKTLRSLIRKELRKRLGDAYG